MKKRERFLSFIEGTTSWWLVLPIYTFLLIGGASDGFLFFIFILWLGIKTLFWLISQDGDIKKSPSSNQNRVPWLSFVLIMVLMTFVAYFVSSVGPDHRTYYKDLPYQAALDAGYSSDQALALVPQINQIQSVIAPSSSGLFLTSTGWFWFVTLELVFGWRVYRWLTRPKKMKSYDKISKLSPDQIEVANSIQMKSSHDENWESTGKTFSGKSENTFHLDD